MGLHDIQIQHIANNTCALTGMYSVYGHLGTSSMEQLIKAFETNNTLKIFIFNARKVDDLTQMDELFETLNQHSSLQALDIATGVELSDDNIAKLEQLIKTRPTLRSLTLGNQVCNATQLKRLTDTLESCEKLKKFMCIINDIPDNVILDITIKLVRYNHLQSIIVNPENITQKQMEDLVNAMESNPHPNLRHLGVAASFYEAGALPVLFNYLEKNTTLTELGLGDITNFSDFKQLVDVMSKNTTLTSLTFEITPAKEFFNASYELISNNNTLKVYQYFTEYSKLESSPELMKLIELADSIEEKISDKIAENKARKNSLQANTIAGNEHSKKRSAYLDLFSTADLKRQRPLDENTSRNTKPPSDDPSSTTIHVKS